MLPAADLDSLFLALRESRLSHRRSHRTRRLDRPRRRSTAPPTCPPGGRTSRPPARTGSRGATTAPSSGTRSGRTPGSASSCRRASVSGRPARSDGGLAVEEERLRRSRPRFSACKPCEVAAIAIQDRVFLGGRFQDPTTPRGAPTSFVVAVDCGDALGALLLRRAGHGPGRDRRLRPRADRAAGRRAIASSSARARPPARPVLAELPTRRRPAERRRRGRAEIVAGAAHAMGGRFEPDGVHDLLLWHLESPRLGRRRRALPLLRQLHARLPHLLLHARGGRRRSTASTAERDRVWDTCFSLRYAEMHGGNTRPTTRSRYRQWLTHKLATWEDQFGTTGCVGCGRCIAWCPVGIDIREEVRCDPRRGGSRMRTLDALIVESPVFDGLDQDAAGADRRLRAERRLPRRRAPLPRGRSGRHVLPRPARARRDRRVRPEPRQLTLETVGPGEIAGWSWLVPPYRWQLHRPRGRARPRDRVRRRLPARQVRRRPRARLRAPHPLLAAARDGIQATRLQLMDVYGDGRS